MEDHWKLCFSSTLQWCKYRCPYQVTEATLLGDLLLHDAYKVLGTKDVFLISFAYCLY